MPDPTPSPAAPAPKSPRKPSGLIDAKNLAELSKHEAVALAAARPEFAAALAKHPDTAAALPGYAKAVRAARDTANRAVAGTAGRKGSTKEEAKDKANLIAAIKRLQGAAKEKYEAAAPDMLANYYVGQRFDRDRTTLEQAADGIWSRLTDKDKTGQPVTPQDTLPAIDPATVATLAALRAKYLGIDLQQAQAGGDAHGARGTLKAQLAALLPLRRNLQRAIDAEFPFTDPANAGVREQFRLQADRGMV